MRTQPARRALFPRQGPTACNLPQATAHCEGATHCSLELTAHRPNFNAHSNRNSNATNARIESADWVFANNSGNMLPFGRLWYGIQWSAFISNLFLSPPGASINALARQPYSIRSTALRFAQDKSSDLRLVDLVGVPACWRRCLRKKSCNITEHSF
jgi:hypothetical protein